MQNPYANATLVSIPFDSDGESGSLTYVFGHESTHEAFSARLQEAALAWLQTDEAREYAEEQGAVGIDWQDLLNAMSPEHMTRFGFANIGSEMGVLPLSDDLVFDLPEVDEDEELDG